MGSKHAIIITSVASMVDQFLIPSINILLNMGYELTICCNFENGNNCNKHNIENLKKNLDGLGIKTIQVDFARNIFCWKNHLKAFTQLKQLLQEKRYHIIHCHSPIGGLLTRLAVKKDKEQRVIYTAHGFHFYKGAPVLNWLLYYPIEKFCSYKTDIMITINTEDYYLAKRKMRAEKIIYIPGIGINIQDNNRLMDNEIKLFRKKCGLQDGDKFLLSVGELNKNKNHTLVIKALFALKKNRPDIRWHYFICGKGTHLVLLEKLIEKLDLKQFIHLVGFSDEVKMYLTCADLFIHPSLREGLSVALMEAIASNIPVICSDIRGNRDLVVDRARFNPFDPKEIESKIIIYLENEDTKNDKILNRKKLDKCSIENISSMLRKVYD